MVASFATVERSSRRACRCELLQRTHRRKTARGAQDTAPGIVPSRLPRRARARARSPKGKDTDAQ
jgi:hypothetical protein